MINDRLILLCDIDFDGGVERRRVSSAPWVTPAGDPDGFMQYAGDMIADPEFQQRVTCAVWTETAQTNIGAIELNNADGVYDGWLGLDAADARVTLRTVRPGQEFGDAVVVWRGILLRVEAVDRTKIRLVLDTFHALFRRPMFTVTMTDTDGNEKPSPVMIGGCALIQPLLFDDATLHYKVSDSRINGLNTIYSSGAPLDNAQWDYDDERAGFVSGITPPQGSRITATGFGNFGFGSNVLPTPDLDAWTSGVPTGYTEISTGTGTITEVPGVGARIQWEAGDYIRLITGTVLPDTDAGWYLIKGRIARLTEGLLYCLFRNEPATLVQINQAGDFAVLTYVPAGADRTFWWGSDDTNAGDLVLDYIEVRKVGANQSQLLPYAIEQVAMVHGPLRYDQIDQDSITALTSAANKTVGYFQPHGGAETIDSILYQILASWTGWWYIDELGRLRVGRLEAPDQMATPDLSLSDLDIIGGVIPRADLAPRLSDSYAGGRRWAPYTESELAGLPLEDPTSFIEPYAHVRKGAGTLHQTYAHARGADPVKTLISGGATQVKAEADRVVGTLFNVRRDLYEVRASLQSSAAALALQPGALVRITYPRYGLGAGRNLRLVGKRCRFLRGEATLFLWG